MYVCVTFRRCLKLDLLYPNSMTKTYRCGDPARLLIGIRNSGLSRADAKGEDVHPSIGRALHASDFSLTSDLASPTRRSCALKILASPPTQRRRDGRDH